jgi:hypothetical protein
MRLPGASVCPPVSRCPAPGAKRQGAIRHREEAARRPGGPPLKLYGKLAPVDTAVYVIRQLRCDTRPSGDPRQTTRNLPGGNRCAPTHGSADERIWRPHQRQRASLAGADEGVADSANYVYDGAASTCVALALNSAPAMAVVPNAAAALATIALQREACYADGITVESAACSTAAGRNNPVSNMSASRFTKNTTPALTSTAMFCCGSRAPRPATATITIPVTTQPRTYVARVRWTPTRAATAGHVRVKNAVKTMAARRVFARPGPDSTSAARRITGRTRAMVAASVMTASTARIAATAPEVAVARPCRSWEVTPEKLRLAEPTGLGRSTTHSLCVRI